MKVRFVSLKSISATVVLWLVLGPVQSAYADIFPASPEQKEAALAFYLLDRYGGDSDFEACARAWRDGKSVGECRDYYREIETFSERIVGHLSEWLLIGMIDFYLGYIDDLGEGCKSGKSIAKEECREERIELLDGLLEEFRERFR